MIKQILENDIGHSNSNLKGVEPLSSLQFLVIGKTADEIEAKLNELNQNDDKPVGVVIFDFLNRDSFEVLFDRHQSTEQEILDYVHRFEI